MGWGRRCATGWRRQRDSCESLGVSCELGGEGVEREGAEQVAAEAGLDLVEGGSGKRNGRCNHRDAPSGTVPKGRFSVSEPPLQRAGAEASRLSGWHLMMTHYCGVIEVAFRTGLAGLAGVKLLERWLNQYEAQQARKKTAPPSA